MKKVFPALIILMVVLLTACSTQAQSSTQVSQTNYADNTPEMTIESKLAVGTLKLEDTDNAVTAEEAKALLPLWKAVRSLSSSDTTSEDEMNALYIQIQETMTAEQISAISEMQLTGEEMRALMAQYGTMSGETDTSGTETSSQAQGGMPGGGPGGMPPGGEMPQGGDPGAMMRQQQNQQGTPDASNMGPDNQRAGMNMMFVEPLIKLLEERAAS